MTFPVSPVNGEKANVNGVTYTYNSTLTAWTVTSNFLDSISANVVAANTVVSATSVSLSAITKTGSNGVGNIGAAASTFNTVFAKATSAQYADLAENYLADAEYTPGTVVVFGGSAEVTVCNTPADTRIAGVVSTEPAYVMNAGLTGKYVTGVALVGRVPVQVTGEIHKGDFMVSAGDGRAMACAAPAMGTVLGRAIENFSGDTGVIEILINAM